MYGVDSRDKEQKFQDELESLSRYLAHCNQDVHHSTVIEAIKRIAASGSEIGRLQAQVGRDDMMHANGASQYPNPQILHLPENTRKVTIEL